MQFVSEDSGRSPEHTACRSLYLRSSEHTDGGDSVEAVAAHQVGDVVLDLHLLARETGSLKQLSLGGIVVLETTEMYRKAACEKKWQDHCRAKQRLPCGILQILRSNVGHFHLKPSFELFFWSQRSLFHLK